MAERLTFTLAGRDELSRVLNNTADASDRLRLRMAGITADADGRLRDLQGNLLTTADAQRRVDDRTGQVRGRFDELGKAADKLGEKLKANLISLAPAAIPASAVLAQSAATVASQFGAAAVAAAAYALALGPQIAAIGEAADAQKKYEDAVAKSGATSQEAIKAQIAYQQQLAQLPPETQKAAVAVGLLKDNFQDWSDSLSGDVVGPFNKGIAIVNTLLPKTTGLAKSASTQLDRLVTELGGAISTPGFDRLTGKFSDFTDRTLDHAVDELNIFLAKLDSGQFSNSGLQKFLDYAKANGPAVWETLQNLGDALLHVLQAGSDVGVGMLDVVNLLSDIVSAVPPDAIATLLQLAIAIKAVRLAAVGGDAAKAALLAISTQIAAMTTAATGAPTRIAAVTQAIGSLSRGAKLAVAGTGIGLLLIALTELSSHSQKAPPDVDKLTTSLKIFADTGKVSGEAARAFGKDLSGLGESLQKVVDPKGLDKVQQAVISFFGTDSTPIKNAKEEIDAFDKALASLVSSGNAKMAEAAIEDTIKKLGLHGAKAEEFRAQLNDVNDALAGQALEQRLAAESMGMFGDQAQKVQAQLDEQKQSADGLRQSIQALNDVNRQGLSGMIGFEAAIDAASKAAKEGTNVFGKHATSIKLNTEAQRTAATALNDLAAKTDEATAAARESGASWAEVSGTYERGRQQLIKNAIQMGLTETAAKKLANQILSTPNKTAYLRGDLEDLKRKLADAKERLRKAPSSKVAAIKGEIEDLKRKIREAQAKIDGLHGKTVLLNVDAVASRNAKNLAGYAHGGLVGGFPGGGLVSGPGTGTSDSVLARVSTGEFVIPADKVREYGAQFFESIRTGQLSPSAGRSALRPGLAAASTAGASGSMQQAAGGGEFTGTLVLDSGQFLGVIKGTVQPMLRESEQRSAYRAKVGRR